LTNQIRNVNLKIEVAQRGEMQRNVAETPQQSLAKIVKDLPGIDSRIQQVKEKNRSIIVTTVAGEMILRVVEDQKTNRR